MDVLNEIKKVRQAYSDDPRKDKFNLLLLGEFGTGKTFVSRTCRLPVHIDSFDPGGTKSVNKWIEAGDIIADIQYEAEDRLSPKMFDRWKGEFTARYNGGYFNHFGTYFLDSSTFWAEAIMNRVLKKAGRAGEAPKFTKDYVPQKIEIRNWMSKILQLPCDVIVTGHLKAIEESDGVKFRYLTTGDGSVVIPLMFDEIYVAQTKETSAGVNYRFLTQSTGDYLARSRLSGEGKLDLYEKSDIKAILKKTNHNYKDKTPLSQLKGGDAADTEEEKKEGMKLTL